MLKSRKLHKILGVILVLPMFGWAITGVVFFIKPGYEGAYETLKLKTYPLSEGVVIPSGHNWTEARVLKSILGKHLLVQEEGKTRHLDLATLENKPLPSQDDLTRLFSDVISQNPQRYGSLIERQGLVAQTSTGIKIELDWDTLRFTQSGLDKKIINTLYKVHYLQWTPWAGVNRVLGLLGLGFVALITIFGVCLLVKGSKIKKPAF